MSGRVRQILSGSAAGGPLTELDSGVLEAGRGLVGDRYYEGKGTFSRKFGGTPAVEATVISQEEIDAFNAATGHSYRGPDFRRTLVTEGVALDGLLGKRFRVGEAVLEGIRFCEPCAHLSATLGREIMDHMVHKAGIRAQIVAGGPIRVGDPVCLVD